MTITVGNYLDPGILDIEANPDLADARGLEDLVARGGPTADDADCPSALPEKYAHPWDNPAAMAMVSATVRAKFEALRSVRFDESEHPRGPDGKFIDKADDEKKPTGENSFGLPNGWTYGNPLDLEIKGNAGKKDTSIVISPDHTIRVYGLNGEPPPKVVIDALNDLDNRFPAEVDRIEVRIRGDMSDDMGGATHSRLDMPHGVYRIDLNAKILPGSSLYDEHVVDDWRDAAADGKLMASSIEDPGRFCVYHEYGHVLDFSSGSLFPVETGIMTQAADNFIRPVSEKGAEAKAAMLTQMSYYATSSPNEAMAEGFADWAITNGTTSSDFSKAVIAALQRAGVAKK